MVPIFQHAQDTFTGRFSRKDGRQAVDTEGPLGCLLTGISPLVVVSLGSIVVGLC